MSRNTNYSGSKRDPVNTWYPAAPPDAGLLIYSMGDGAMENAKPAIFPRRGRPLITTGQPRALCPKGAGLLVTYIRCDESRLRYHASHRAPGSDKRQRIPAGMTLTERIASV